MTSLLNPAIQNRASLHIPGLEHVAFQLKNVELPGLSAQAGSQNTPKGILPREGSVIEYGDLPIEFHVSGDLSEYISAQTWLTRSHISKGPAQYQMETPKQITLYIYDPHYQVVQTVQFYECVPIELSSLQYDQSSSTVSLSATITIDYTYYEFT